jgi:hypothetical protein
MTVNIYIINYMPNFPFLYVGLWNNQIKLLHVNQIIKNLNDNGLCSKIFKTLPSKVGHHQWQWEEMVE